MDAINNPKKTDAAGQPGTTANIGAGGTLEGGRAWRGTLTDEELAKLNKGVCPDCGGTDFLKGPEAGLCANIKCAGCGAKFNVGPLTGERIGTAPIAQGDQAQGDQLEQTQEQDQAAEQGAEEYPTQGLLNAVNNITSYLKTLRECQDEITKELNLIFQLLRKS